MRGISIYHGEPWGRRYLSCEGFYGMNEACIQGAGLTGGEDVAEFEDVCGVFLAEKGRGRERLGVTKSARRS